MPFDFAPKPDSPIDFKSLEDEIEVKIDVSSMNEFADLWDAISERVKSAQRQVESFESQVAELKNVDPGSSKIGELEGSIVKLNDEITKTPKFLKFLSKEFANAATQSVNLLEGISGISVNLKDEDWIKYSKSVSGSTKNLKASSEAYAKNGAIIKKNQAALRDYQEKLMSGTKLTQGEIEEVNKLRIAILTAAEATGVIETSFESLIEMTDDLEDGLKSDVDAVGLFAKEAKKAKREADGFADGLGGTATGSLAAGVALVYVAGKVTELGETLEKTQKTWAKYSLQSAIASNTIPKFDESTGGLENLRKSLRLTGEEALNLTELLKSGSESGVASVEQLVEAASKLEDVFGEDPSNRLGKYVDLLKQIPTLETDLSITASVDDQAAAWFTLAEQGKVSQVIELQMAGLLGGEEAELGEEADTAVASLHALNKMESVQSTIEKHISTFIPASIAYFTKSAGFALKAGGSAVTLYRATLTTNSLLGNILTATENNKPGMTSDRTITKTPTGTKVSLGQSIKNMFKKKGSFTGTPKVVGASSIGTGIVGKQLSILGGTVSSLTGEVGSLSSTMANTTSSIGSSSAGIISKLGSVAAVVGAAVGPFILIGKHGEDVGNGMVNLGKRFENTTGIVGVFGASLVSAGKGISTAGKFWDYFYKKVTEDMSLTKEELKIRKATWKAELHKKRELGKEIILLKKRHMSALALQKSLSFLKSAIESPITSFAKLETEVANIDLDTLASIGGSVAGFENAIKSGARGLKREFSQMNKSFDIARSMIVGDAEMTSEDRRAGLLKIHKGELEATKKLINGLVSMAGRFEEIPEVAKVALENAIRTSLSDLQIESGGDLFGGAFESFSANLKNMAASLAVTTSQMGKEFERSAEIGAIINKKSKINGAEFSDALKGITAGLRDSSDLNLVKDLEASLTLDGEVQVKDKKDETAKRVSEAAQKRLDELAVEMDNLSGGSLLASYDKVISEKLDVIKKEKLLNRQLKEIQDSLNDASRLQAGATTKHKLELEHMDKLNEIKKLKIVSINSAIKNQEKIENQLIIEGKKRIKSGKIFIDSAKKEVLTKKQILTHAQNSLTKDKNKLDNLSKEEKALLELRRRSTQVVDMQKKGTAELQSQNKSIEAYVGQFQKFLSQINRLGELIENDPTVQTAKRRVELLEQQQELNLLSGKSVEAFTKTAQAENILHDKKIGLIKESLALLKTFKDGGEGQVKILESINESLSSMPTIISTLFSDGNMSSAMKTALGDVNKIKKDLNDQASVVKDAYGKLQTALASGDPKEISKFAKNLATEKRKLDEDIASVKKKASDAGLEFDTSSVEGLYDGMMVAISASTGGVQKHFDKTTVSLGKAMVDKARTFDKTLNKFLDSIDKTPFQEASKAAQEQAESMMGLSKELLNSDGAAIASAKSFNSISASRIDKLKQINDLEVQSNALYSEQISNLIAAGASEEKLLEVRLLQSKNADELAKAKADVELKGIQDIVKNVKSQYDIEYDILNIKQEELDIQKDILDFSGANYDLIHKAQIMDIQIARERSSIIAKELSDLESKGAGAGDIERKRLELMKQQAEIQKKTMGAQRDAFDRIMDKAFGGIRSSQGAQRQVMTDAQLFGSGAVKNSVTGLFTEGGGAKTMAQRQAEFALAGPSKKDLKPEEINKKASEVQETSAKLQKEAADTNKVNTKRFGGWVTKLLSSAKNPIVGSGGRGPQDKLFANVIDKTRTGNKTAIDTKRIYSNLDSKKHRFANKGVKYSEADENRFRKAQETARKKGIQDKGKKLDSGSSDVAAKKMLQIQEERRKMLIDSIREAKNQSDASYKILKTLEQQREIAKKELDIAKSVKEEAEWKQYEAGKTSIKSEDYDKKTLDATSDFSQKEKAFSDLNSQLSEQKSLVMGYNDKIDKQQVLVIEVTDKIDSKLDKGFVSTGSGAVDPYDENLSGKNLASKTNNNIPSNNVPYSVVGGRPSAQPSTGGDRTNQVAVGGGEKSAQDKNSAGAIGTGTTAQTINANVNAVITVDADGNIGAYVKKVVQETVPSVIKSPDGQAAMDQAGVLRKGQI